MGKMNGSTQSFGLLLALFAIVAAGASAQPSRKATSPVRELTALEDGWARALIRRDTVMFRKYLSDDFVYTENADVMGKQDVLNSVVGTDTVTWSRNESMKVHLHGSTGVVTGILAMKGRGKDGPFDKRYRFTDTWVSRNGGWQIVAAQDYLIPKR